MFSYFNLPGKSLFYKSSIYLSFIPHLFLKNEEVCNKRQQCNGLIKEIKKPESGLENQESIEL